MSAGPVLDVGSGGRREGRIGLDRSVAAGPDLVGDATALPVRDRSCGTVLAERCLYFVARPEDAVAEAHRVLRPGGAFVATTTARTDSPELHEWFDPPEATTFDAEEAAEVVAAVFAEVAVEAWEHPDVLATRTEVEAHLQHRGVSWESAEEVAAEVALPFTVTRRGVTVRATR